MKNTEKMAYISNYPPLESFLRRIDARCLNQTPFGAMIEAEHERDDYPSAYLETWLANGRVFMVEVRANGMGWNIYTDGNSSNILDTLKDAAQRLGVQL